jgi:hypothetical protein
VSCTVLICDDAIFMRTMVGFEARSLPMVLQYNKQDLPDALVASVAELQPHAAMASIGGMGT